jgi:CheY-like chemotaxis protein
LIVAAANSYRIVLIEDNPFDARVLRYAFDHLRKSYLLEVLANEDEVAQFLVEAAAPSLIILDLHLPKCDGITILKELHSCPVLSAVPVVILSSAASPREMQQILEMGIRMYRTKPMNWTATVGLAGELMDICMEGNRAMHHARGL